MKLYIYVLMALLLVMSMTACDKKDQDDDQNVFVPMDELIVTDNFDWNTMHRVSIDLQALTNVNQPIENMFFQIFDKDPNKTGAALLYRGMTDQNGDFQIAVNLPTRLQSIWIAGYMKALEFSTSSGQISYLYGGSQSHTRSGEFSKPVSSKDYLFLPGMTFNSQGVPSPMQTDAIPAGLITDLNNIFIEGQDLPSARPDFFLSNTIHLLKVDEPANVKITFLSEDASYRNTIGFYVIDQNAVINTPADLGPLTVVFPNASLVNSGGGLVAGDMVDLGTIPGGKYVGYFLLSNAWISGSNFNDGLFQYYSHNHLNPEATPSNQVHPVQAFSATYQKMIVAFEDKNRDPGMGSDDDFNDAILAITAQPWSAIDIEDVPPLDPGTDPDGDGVPTPLDDYPDDFDRAFDNYTPGPDTWGSLAYEDLWPAYGDYDFNDLVIAYRINQVTDSRNRVKDIKSEFKVKAIGASFRNGFAMEMPFSSSVIQSITSNLNLHSIENGGSKAVVRVFNNAFDVIPQVPGQFINTVVGQPYHSPVLITLDMVLSQAQNPDAFNYVAPYNPFIFRTDNRGLEVHLADYTPTEAANLAMLGTVNDTSNPASGRYYKSIENLPWALHIADDFDHPIERAQITHAYVYFKNWAQSSGASYPNWYQDNPGYRNNEYIYQIP